MFKTVGIIYVSCPILRGNSADQSTPFLVNQLNFLNYEVQQITIMYDQQNKIADELSRLSKYLDIILVITDLKSNTVLEAIADISNEKNCIKNHSSELSCGHKIPFSARVLGSIDVKYPVVYFSRIYILAEDLLVQQFSLVKYHLEQYRKVAMYKIVIEAQLNGNSKTVLEKLNRYQIHTEKGDKFIKVVVENSSLENIVADQQVLKEVLPDGAVQVYGNGTLFDDIFQAENVHIQQAISDIRECLAKYGPHNVFLSFNGGKDCTVLLHLTYMIMKATYPNYNRSIFCLYVKSENSFEEQDNFIEQCRVFYNLDVLEVTMGMKEALSIVLKTMPYLKACLIGTRRTDPYSQNLHLYQMTDPDWPTVMRVNPVLDWTYCDIWDYLLFYKVPYCKLYDEGYTSLGSTNNTIRNPHLLYHDVETDMRSYLPAYKLLDKTRERDGRNVKTN